MLLPGHVHPSGRGPTTFLCSSPRSLSFCRHSLWTCLGGSGWPQACHPLLLTTIHAHALFRDATISHTTHSLTVPQANRHHPAHPQFYPQSRPRETSTRTSLYNSSFLPAASQDPSSLRFPVSSPTCLLKSLTPSTLGPLPSHSPYTSGDPLCSFPHVCIGGTSVFAAQNTFWAPRKRGLAVGVGSKTKGLLGSSGWEHAGRGQWTFLDLKAQKVGEEGGPCGDRQGQTGGVRPQPVPFRGDSCIKLQFSGRLN